MKAKLYSMFIALTLPLASYGQSGFAAAALVPEQFTVVDVIPNYQSAETVQNAEPSLAVGTGPNFGSFVVHAFSPIYTLYGGVKPYWYNLNNYYTSVDGGILWTNPGAIYNLDCTLDWSSGGTNYAAYAVSTSEFDVAPSAGLPGTYTPIPAAKVYDWQMPDQPWVRVVNVPPPSGSGPNQDHIYVGFNERDQTAIDGGNGRTASVHYSMDSGSTWHNTVIERGSTTYEGGALAVGADSPAVRIAISPDGTRVYALFQRLLELNGNYWPINNVGCMVLTRDDNFAGTFTSLSGTGHNADVPASFDSQVTTNTLLPADTSLGAERISSDCDVAINPSNPDEVYVAYTFVYSNNYAYYPLLRVQHSINGGVTFTNIYTSTNEASMPALAVLTDGTLGLLYASLNGANLEVDFLKFLGSPHGDFTPKKNNLRVLASWPDGNPAPAEDPYIGDYFQLKAAGMNFYGVFSASNDPQTASFPSGAYFQRDLDLSSDGVNFQVKSNLFFPKNDAVYSTLCDSNGIYVAPSIDPFFFRDIAPTYISTAIYPNAAATMSMVYQPNGGGSVHPGGPGSPVLTWAVLPANYPQFLLQSSPVPGAGAAWTTQTNNLIQTNGQFVFTPVLTNGQQFFRLNQNVASGQFATYAAAVANGTLSPSGILTNAGLASQTFTATPASSYGVKDWLLDGTVVQSGGSTLTVSNISSEHTLQVTFAPTNDIAVSLAGYAALSGPALVGNPFIYEIDIANTGLGTVTGVSVTNLLDPAVTFLSATGTQGSVTNFGSVILASVGTLSPGSSARILLTVMPDLETNISDTVVVACNQSEPNFANNIATSVATVLTPVSIVTNPTNRMASSGGTASFNVGVAGTPPFYYQWLFNGAVMAGATNATLTLSNVTPAEAGSYSVQAFQIPGPEDIQEADSTNATLQVN